MLSEKKTIQRSGSSMVVPLTAFFKKMGLNLGNEVSVFLDDGEILITNNDNTKKRIPSVDKEVWSKFISVIVELRGYENLNKKNIQNCMEDAMKEWIKKKTSFWKKPLLP